MWWWINSNWAVTDWSTGLYLIRLLQDWTIPRTALENFTTNTGLILFLLYILGSPLCQDTYLPFNAVPLSLAGFEHLPLKWYKYPRVWFLCQGSGERFWHSQPSLRYPGHQPAALQLQPGTGLLHAWLPTPSGCSQGPGLCTHLNVFFFNAAQTKLRLFNRSRLLQDTLLLRPYDPEDQWCLKCSGRTGWCLEPLGGPWRRIVAKPYGFWNKTLLTSAVNYTYFQDMVLGLLLDLCRDLMLDCGPWSYQATCPS
jgi:hypothetical protein